MPFRISFLEEPPRSLSRGPLFLPHGLLLTSLGIASVLKKSFVGDLPRVGAKPTRGTTTTHCRSQTLSISAPGFCNALIPRTTPQAFAVLRAQSPTPPRASQFHRDPRAPSSSKRRRAQRRFITKDDPSPESDPSSGRYTQCVPNAPTGLDPYRSTEISHFSNLQQRNCTWIMQRLAQQV